MTTKAATGKKGNFSAFLFILVWSEVRIRRVFYFYMVKWCQYLNKVDYQFTVSCALLFQCCLPKIINICSDFLVINQNTLSIFTSDTIKTALSMTS